MQEKNKKNFKEIADEFLIGKEESPDVAIERLKKIKDFSQNDAILILNYFAEIEKNPNTLFHILKEIGKYKDKSSSQILIELLTGYKKEDARYLKVRCSIAGILGNIKDDSAILPLMYVMNDREEDYKLRLAAAESLGKIGNNQAVMPLIKIVSDDEEKSVYLKESATKALGMLGDERAVEPLISLLDLQKDILDKFTYLRERIVQALGKLNFKKDRRIQVLRNVLNDKSAHVRASAIEALSEIDEDIVVEFIEPMIYDENESVAKTAIYALYNIEGEDCLIKLLSKKDLPAVCREEINEILAEEEMEKYDEQSGDEPEE